MDIRSRRRSTTASMLPPCRECDRARRCRAPAWFRSPPVALQGPVGAIRLIKAIQLRHGVVREHEVENARVLRDAISVGRFRDDDEATLQAPAQEDLRGRAPYPRSHPLYGRVGQVATSSKRAVGLERDAPSLRGVEQP